MPGLVPGIHVFTVRPSSKTRMAGIWCKDALRDLTRPRRRGGHHHAIRAFRRPDRRRRAVRHRRGLSSAAEMPGQELRHSRGARLHRRHLGSVPLSRHPLRLRHVHARLFVQAVDRAEGDRRRAADPELCPRDRRRERHRQQDPLQPSRQARVVVDAGRALDRGGRAQSRARARPRSCASPAISCSCARAITNTRKAIRRNFPGPRISPAASCIRRNGPTISTTPASAWW